MDKQKLLNLLEANAKMTLEELSEALGDSTENIAAQIDAFENEKVILGYNAMIDWEKTKRATVTAMIELKVVPTRGQGFDALAERLVNYPEVKSLYLMSGGYDIWVLIEGKTLREVAMFVAKKVAPMDGVKSTGTHFVLTKYKDKGVIFCDRKGDTRRLFSYD
ncbi:MAG: Lrp/AsnC family transcriptional regulator [Clostridia bacterium]|nr:Lrp/AsnC family transcriptional regulator [Clostridia bacterium]